MGGNGIISEADPLYERGMLRKGTEMTYEGVEKAVFLRRPNRFVAEVEKDGAKIICHVKNTGRCRELLLPGTEVYIQKSSNAERKTAYDLIAVKKGSQVVNMDSQIPNQVIREMLEEGRLLPNVTSIRPETTYGSSRFDFYVETEEGPWFIEVKGVTLEEDGTAKFPDAPTERGVRHMRELMESVREGYHAMICFIIQMKGVDRFQANAETQPEFAKVLKEARNSGVEVRAYDCVVTQDSIRADKEIPVQYQGENDTDYILQDIVDPLIGWFRGHARILPWREDASSYRVWISEIMLQQTRVEAVKPYFERFIGSLPDMESLANVPEDRLMKLWEGLGYYNRARNLQKTAREVMKTYGGVLPADYEKLLKLPGIGSYTAGAVSSIAYGIPVPAVDGNVLRVWSRLFLREEDILKQSVKTAVEKEFLAVMPKENPGEFNQALMELGATVCVPNGMAKCEECPLAFLCQARKTGRVMEFPKKASKKPRKIEERTVFVIRSGDRTVIGQRPKKGLLAGLYELPNAEGHFSQEEALTYVKELGFSPIRILPLADAKHIFSHVEWQMKGYVIRVEEIEKAPKERLLLVAPRETEEKYPIPTAFRAYTSCLEMKLGYEAGQTDRKN